MSKELVITKKINLILKSKSLTAYKISKIIGVSDSALYGMIKGETPFSADFIQKIAPVLELSPIEIKGWILADKYPKEILQRALELKEEYAGQEELIFTTRIHEIMKAKNLNICAFAREIGYNQGLLSQVVLGKEPVSKKLMEKLCAFSGLPKGEITSWSVADKYSREALRLSVIN